MDLIDIDETNLRWLVSEVKNGTYTSITDALNSIVSNERKKD